MPDWIDDLLDRHPCEPVPPDFAERVRAAVDSSSAGGRKTPGSPRVLRPGFKRLLPAAAAAVVFLAVGFFLGRDASFLGLSGTGETVSIEAPVDDLEELRLLQAWELVADESLDPVWSDPELWEEAGELPDTEEDGR